MLSPQRYQWTRLKEFTTLVKYRERDNDYACNVRTVEAEWIPMWATATEECDYDE